TKLFCGCSTKFGAPPNTQTCPVCIGMPGTLPVMNRRAFELALRTAAGLNCTLAEYTKWDRKNYYYPDLPKGYQISQYDLPFSANGWLEIVSPTTGELRKIGITRAHLEEDAGKSLHDEVSGKGDTRVDLNRAGTPLVEIVSEPDMRSSAEAREYLTELKLLLTYLNVSDCNMQEGSLRVDANVNLHIETDKGKIATPIVEIKNMNSFSSVERALNYEIPRQYAVWQETGKVKGSSPKQTRGWDDINGETYPQREKEDVSDYRFFPEPDLVPVALTKQEIADVIAAVGELPSALRRRLEKDFGLTAYDADVLVNQGQPLVAYFLEAVKSTGDGKLVSNWIQQDVLKAFKEKGLTIETYPVSAPALSELLGKVKAKEIDTTRGREILAAMVESGKPLAAVMAELGVVKVDESELIELCRQIVEANPKMAAEIKGGKLQAAGALVGQAKKKNPNVNPGRVREIILELIGTA
ncbi:MAG TPA: Asp-tRNA(Asn)/Glu-tRNA(Gln) amidotransferase subunit GatB, partial [Pirellulales bacterium]